MHIIATFCCLADMLRSWGGRTVVVRLLLQQSRMSAIAGSSAWCGVTSPQTPDLFLQLARQLLERAVLGLQALQLSMFNCLFCYLHMPCAGQEANIHSSHVTVKLIFFRSLIACHF